MSNESDYVKVEYTFEDAHYTPTRLTNWYGSVNIQKSRQRMPVAKLQPVVKKSKLHKTNPTPLYVRNGYITKKEFYISAFKRACEVGAIRAGQEYDISDATMYNIVSGRTYPEVKEQMSLEGVIYKKQPCKSNLDFDVVKKAFIECCGCGSIREPAVKYDLPETILGSILRGTTFPRVKKQMARRGYVWKTNSRLLDEGILRKAFIYACKTSSCHDAAIRYGIKIPTLKAVLTGQNRKALFSEMSEAGYIYKSKATQLDISMIY